MRPPTTFPPPEARPNRQTGDWAGITDPDMESDGSPGGDRVEYYAAPREPLSVRTSHAPIRVIIECDCGRSITL